MTDETENYILIQLNKIDSQTKFLLNHFTKIPLTRQDFYDMSAAVNYINERMYDIKMHLSFQKQPK